jgi:hypothetical protein
VNLYAKLAAAAAAVLVVGFVGWRLLPGDGGMGGQPTPMPTMSPAAVPTTALPTASPEPFTCEEGVGCAGFLASGDHQTRQFAPAFQYTVPADWMNPIDLETIVGLTPIDRPADLILVWSGAVPADHTGTCDLRARPGAGSTADQWMTYLTEHPGLDAVNLRSLTINGQNARSVDVRSFGGWTSPCVADQADFNVPILKVPEGAPGDGYGVRIGAEARVYAIEVGSETVIVTVYAYQGWDVEIAGAAALAEPIVTSFRFDPR